MRIPNDVSYCWDKNKVILVSRDGKKTPLIWGIIHKHQLLSEGFWYINKLREYGSITGKKISPFASHTMSLSVYLQSLSGPYVGALWKLICYPHCQWSDPSSWCNMSHLPFLFLCTKQAMPVSYISSGCSFFFSKHWFLTVITPLESPSSAWYFTEAEDGYVSGTYTILRVRFITQPCFGAYNLSAKSLEPSVL